MNNVNVR